MGRHSSGLPGSGAPLRTLAFVGGAVALAGIGIIFGTGELRDNASSDATPTCSHATVLAPPEIAQVVRDRAETLKDSGGCAAITVTEAGPSEIGRLAATGVQHPDAWISDSPNVVTNFEEVTKRELEASSGEVFASSPIVIAVPAGIATEMNTGVKPWITALSSAPLTSAPPADNTSSLLAFVNVWQQLRNNPIGGAVLGDAFFKIIRESSPQDTLLQQAGAEAKAFPASEQQIAAAAAAHPDSPMRALIPAEGTPSLEYALTRLGEPSGEAAKALDSLESALRDESGRKALLDAGFRVDGARSGPVSDIPDQMPGQAPQLDQMEVDKMLTDWAYINRDLRLLAVVDVSGSMLADAGETRRIDLAVTAVQQAVRLMKPTSDAGLWVFSTAQQGKIDHRPVAAVRTVGNVDEAGSHGAVLLRAASGIPAHVRGDTGLNDTILAAYLEMQKSYAADRDNLIVVITDGRNDDSTGGLTTDQLIARLKSAADPKRPVRVIVVGMGTAGDQAVMARVTSEVQGRAYYVNDPTEIPAAFGSAIWSTNR